MGIGSKIGELFGNSAGEIIESVGTTVDRFIHTGEEKAEWELEKRKLELQLKEIAFEAEKAYLADRDSARKMYEHDSGLQKVFAITFLVGYLLMSGLMVYVVVGLLGKGGFEVPSWAVSLISAVFTAMSMKVNTIVDFLFGGSQGERDNAGAISRGFETASNNGGTASSAVADPNKL